MIFIEQRSDKYGDLYIAFRKSYNINKENPHSVELIVVGNTPEQIRDRVKKYMEEHLYQEEVQELFSTSIVRPEL